MVHKVDVYNEEHTKNKLLIRKYEKEITDLKFLNSQFIIQTKQAEKKFVSERKKIEELLKINSDTSNSTKKGKEKNFYWNSWFFTRFFLFIKIFLKIFKGSKKKDVLKTVLGNLETDDEPLG